ncbi:MAG: hypothetical protein R3B53_04350 [Candidatus Paceibacterota bacterium]
MLKQFFRRSVVGVLILMFIFTATLYPGTSYAKTEAEEQLEQLSKDLIIAGDFIMSSETITADERLVLMSQLIAVSNAILTLRKSMRGTVVEEEEVDESGRVSAKEAKINRVIVKFDAPTNTAEVEIITSTTTIENVYKFASVAEKATYEGKIRLVKEEVVTEVSSTTNVVSKDIEDLMFLTSRNPNRINYIHHNSVTANAAFEAFGENSIVNKVVVSPGLKSGSIEFFSDQDESLKLSLAKEFGEHRESGTYELDTYLYRYEFYVSTDMDKYVDLEDDGDGRRVFVKTPKISNTASGVKKEEIVKAITDLFKQVPFTSRVPQFQDKLLKFLTNNRTLLGVSRLNYSYSGSLPDCYYASDKVVVLDFIKYLSDGLDVQYEGTAESMTSFVTPQEVDEDRYYVPTCLNKNHSF